MSEWNMQLMSQMLSLSLSLSPCPGLVLSLLSLQTTAGVRGLYGVAQGLWLSEPVNGKSALFTVLVYGGE